MLASSLCSLFWTRPTVRGNTMLSPVGSSRGPLDTITKVLRARGKRWGQGGRADIKPKPCVAARSVIMLFAMEASKLVALPEPKQVNFSCAKHARQSLPPGGRVASVGPLTTSHRVHRLRSL